MRMRISGRSRAFSLALAGRLDEARGHAAAIRRALPHYRVDDFLTAMQFAPEDQRLFREAARRSGSTDPCRLAAPGSLPAKGYSTKSPAAKAWSDRTTMAMSAVLSPLVSP